MIWIVAAVVVLAAAAAVALLLTRDGDGAPVASSLSGAAASAGPSLVEYGGFWSGSLDVHEEQRFNGAWTTSAEEPATAYFSVAAVPDSNGSFGTFTVEPREAPLFAGSITSATVDGDALSLGIDYAVPNTGDVAHASMTLSRSGDVLSGAYADDSPLDEQWIAWRADATFSILRGE